MKKPSPLPDVSKYFRDPPPKGPGPDWGDAAFQTAKAFVCCVFSEAAYRSIPLFEFARSRRIKLVPCFAYQWLQQEAIKHDVRALLPLPEGFQTFVVSTQRVIALGFVRPHLIIIALRGTASFYDVLSDIDVGQATLDRVYPGLILHEGFYSAVSELCADLSEELMKYAANRPTVYVTGHSLGGAMAAILHGMWDDLLPLIINKSMRSLCAYTYAMPRYANEVGVEKLQRPYPIYNPYDVVPYLPPRAWGFGDHFVEFSADNLKDEKRLPSKQLPWNSIFSVRRNHMIETYRKKIHAIILSEEKGRT